MVELKGSKTEKNLLAAFAGESQARNRYTYFASVARKEGYEQIAAIFIETADNEREHAKRFFKFLPGGEGEIHCHFPSGRIGTTAENLLAAAEGEHLENDLALSRRSPRSPRRGLPRGRQVLRNIAKVEWHHEDRYRKLKANLDEGKVFEKEEKVTWICRKCGFVHTGTKALAKCPACDHPTAYMEVCAENY